MYRNMFPGCNKTFYSSFRGTKEEKIPQREETCLMEPGNVISRHGESENCELMDFSMNQESENHERVLPERQKPHYSYK